MTTDQVKSLNNDDLRSLVVALADAREATESAKAALRAAQESVAPILADPLLAYKQAVEREEVIEDTLRTMAALAADEGAVVSVPGVKIVTKTEKSIADEKSAVAWLIERNMTNVLGVADRKKAIAIAEAAGADWLMLTTRNQPQIASDLRAALGGAS